MPRTGAKKHQPDEEPENAVLAANFAFLMRGRTIAGLRQEMADAGFPIGTSAIQLARKGKGNTLTVTQKFADYFGVSAGDLVSRPLSEARTSGAPTNAAAPHQVANTEPGPDVRGEVPLISWVAASSWCEAGDPFQPGDAEEWLPCPSRHSTSTFALRVRGDSMTAPHGNSRTYPEGCVIFVDPERCSPVNGDRIIARLEGAAEVTFKVYKNEDGRQWLAPLNPSHEPIREPFRVLGTIIGKWEAE